MDAGPSPNLEPVYIAGNVREVQLIEELLAREGIEYEVTPEAFVHTISAGACFQGLLFLVLSGQAAYCRSLFSAAGLRGGIVPADAE